MYFLNINKPKGISSFECIRILRKKLKIKSIGHSGTLDPLASGVLQIAVGSATKLIEFLPSDKTYIADIKFGYISDTDDSEGVKRFISKPNFNEVKLRNTLDLFVGKTLQIPPKYSAIKYKGKKLCDIARRNPELEIEIKPRQIEIYSIDLLNFTGDSAKIQVHCKKGTYIRSLIKDIGDKLGCGAYMTDLIRIKAGNFNIEDSDNLDSETFNIINPLNAVIGDRLELDDLQYNRIMNGCPISLICEFNSNYVLLTKNNKLVSIANLSDNPNSGYKILKPRKNFKEG